jgi:hypothetical protein
MIFVCLDYQIVFSNSIPKKEPIVIAIAKITIVITHDFVLSLMIF